MKKIVCTVQQQSLVAKNGKILRFRKKKFGRIDPWKINWAAHLYLEIFEKELEKQLILQIVPKINLLIRKIKQNKELVAYQQ